jgi:hypothetical protein
MYFVFALCSYILWSPQIKDRFLGVCIICLYLDFVAMRVSTGTDTGGRRTCPRLLWTWSYKNGVLASSSQNLTVNYWNWNSHTIMTVFLEMLSDGLWVLVCRATTFAESSFGAHILWCCKTDFQLLQCSCETFSVPEACYGPHPFSGLCKMGTSLFFRIIQDCDERLWWRPSFISFRIMYKKSVLLECAAHQNKQMTEETAPLWSSGQSSWLQIRRPGFDSRHYQEKKQ